jgi:para-aminobenzoate synthetase/4-amino-4-deoxychorismate lyase
MRRRAPDPALGVFETLLLVDGRPLEPDAHLQRLAASLERLYGARLPGEARLLAGGLGAAGLSRLRLTVTPGAGGLECRRSAEAVPEALLFPAWEDGAELQSLALAGGLGAHKWADRSLLPETRGRAVPLLLDDGAEVLEAAWASVFAVCDGVLVTSPADARILPGVTRAAAIAIAREQGLEVVERRVYREELGEAEEVFLTGSVRGVVPAQSLDGGELGSGEISAFLADRLRRRWRIAGGSGVARSPAAVPSPGSPAR